MPGDLPILNKLRSAQIPIVSYTTSLRKEKQNVLADIIQKREFETGPAGLANYTLCRGAKAKGDVPSVAKVCAIFAKELALLGRQVYYATLGELTVSLRMYERGIESVYSIHDRIGKGYIVVGDLGKNTTELPAQDWMEIQSLLLSHLSRGGGLILGIDYTKAVFTSELADVLTVFTPILVE